MNIQTAMVCCLALFMQSAACNDSGEAYTDGTDDGTDTMETTPINWPIADTVYTTAQQQVLPIAVSADTPQIGPEEVSLYAEYGYSDWEVGTALPHVRRSGLAPDDTGAQNAARLLTFFTFTDIHIADKESPAQVNYIGLAGGYGSGASSAYSPVILSSTHVLDAAVQTVNALHRTAPFDFGIILGDDINNTQYNELRWFIDVMDGMLITPSSGAHKGADTIDYQMPYQAAGLDRSIPWYQVLGNHDQFWMGSKYENEKTMNAHVSNTIINTAFSLDPNADILSGTGFYMGVVDGATPYGDIVGAGPEADFSTPPTVIADADRHTLSTSDSSSQNWMSEFFETETTPVGHGFTQSNLDKDFACYSFLPKADIPIKIISLDDTCKGDGQPMYAAGCLDTLRLDWLKSELQAGQDQNQLMIIAAHIPIKPQKSLDDTTAFPIFFTPGFTDDELLAVLHDYSNLILWISGHRHMNVVTPQPSPDITNHPEQSFWEVETSSLRDFPQEFRTFDIRRNTDNTVSIIVTNVDPAVAAGSPAAKSRDYAIGASRVYNSYPLTDSTSHAYNAELLIQLTAEMQAVAAASGTPITE